LDKIGRNQSVSTVDCAEGRGLTTATKNRQMAGPRPSSEADPEIELFVKVSF